MRLKAAWAVLTPSQNTIATGFWYQCKEFLFCDLYFTTFDYIYNICIYNIYICVVIFKFYVCIFLIL